MPYENLKNSFLDFRNNLGREAEREVALLKRGCRDKPFFPCSPVSIIEKPGVLLPDGLRVSSIIFPGDRAIKQIRNLSDQQTARRTDQCVGYGWESGWALLALAMYGVNYK